MVAIESKKVDKIRIKKIPCFNLWLEQKFNKGESEWDPHVHEDWVLPPFVLFKEYTKKYPPDYNKGNFEVIP